MDTSTTATTARIRVGFGDSPFTLGTWPMSGDANYGHIDEREAIATIHAALEAGITSFDTAPGYGQGYAETLLGTALSGRRERAVITTKFGVRAGRGRDSSRSSILEEVHDSLRRLRTDYIDYYVAHWPDKNTAIEETVETLDGLVAAGKVRRIGYSNYTVELLERCRAVRPIDAVQVGYSLFDRRMEREMFPYCLQHRIPVMAYGPLAHGMIVDDIREDTTYSATDWRTKGFAIGQPIFTPENFRQNIRVVHRLRDEVAKTMDVSVARLAISWVLDHPAVTTVLIGARTPAELRKDIERPVVLVDRDKERIDAILQDVAGRVDVFRPYARGHEDWSK
jgi:aryl-alcohol dehydrogenase-like predicted oxidoreductase